MTTDSPLTRRQFAKGVGAAGIAAAAAGCIADPSGRDGAPPRPEYGRDPSALDQPLQYIVRSVHYQNSYFDHGGSNLPARPQFPGSASGYDHDLRFVLESLEYQNAAIQSEAGD